MYNSYAVRLYTNISRTPSAPSHATTLKEDEVELLDLIEEIRDIQGTSSYYSTFPNFHNKSGSSGLLVIPEELRNYFKQQLLINIEPTDSLQFDLHEFWQTNERRYPIISSIAKDLLTPLVSMVASESDFSADKRTLSKVRSRLKEDILEALMCVKVWLDAHFRKQNKYVEIACSQVNDI